MTGYAEVDEEQPDDGRLRVTGNVAQGEWVIDRASPALAAAELSDAFGFIADMFEPARQHADRGGARRATVVPYAFCEVLATAPELEF